MKKGPRHGFYETLSLEKTVFKCHPLMPEFLATLEPLFQTFLCVQYLNFEGGLVFAFKIEKVFCVKRKLLK